jgi:D-arabinose 1-dehydrogenase-like Zn-dependent alcohol dehydrogenase
VIGCGGLGLVCISVLRAKGVKNIIGCDIDAAKLEAAKKLGARLTLDTRAPDAVQRLQGLAMGSLAGAIDLVGMPATVALGLGALRKGGRHVLCGLFGGEIVHPLPPFAQRAIGLVGSYVGNLQELKEVVALAKKKKLKPTPVQVRPAAEVTQVLEDLKAGKVLGRTVLAL